MNEIHSQLILMQ